MSVEVRVDVTVGPETSLFLRLVRWRDAAQRERVSVRAMRKDMNAEGVTEICEGEADVDLHDLVSAVDALVARPR